MRALSRSRFERDRRGLQVVERVGAFVRAVDAGLVPELVLHAPPLLGSPVAQQQLRRLRRDGVPVERVAPETFRGLHTATRASGLAAVFAQRRVPLASAEADGGLCWLVVEHMRSAGNLGTILRTAEAVGAAGLVVLGDADPYAPGVQHASLGAVALLPVVRATPAAFARWAAEREVTVVLADERAPVCHDEVRWPARCAVMVGEERRGVSVAARRTAGLCVRLPQVGRADSLNVAVAAGVLLYAALTARRARETLARDPSSHPG